MVFSISTSAAMVQATVVPRISHVLNLIWELTATTNECQILTLAIFISERSKATINVLTIIYSSFSLFLLHDHDVSTIAICSVKLTLHSPNWMRLSLIWHWNSQSTMSTCNIKNAHLHSSLLGLPQFTWKFTTTWNSPFQKNVSFLSFRFLHFWRGNDVTKFLPNFIFSIIG